MVSVRIYVEGGGSSSAQQRQLAGGLSVFLERAGLKGKKPSIIPCGGRNNAFDDFLTALKTHPKAISILLIDSEDPVPENMRKWDFLRQRDKWEKPDTADESQVYLMVQCMETWLLADPDALAGHYKANFNPKALSLRGNSLESLRTADIYERLKKSTFAPSNKNTGGNSYSKGKHSFQLIGLIDPKKVCAACPSAQQFVDYLLKIS